MKLLLTISIAILFCVGCREKPKPVYCKCPFDSKAILALFEGTYKHREDSIKALGQIDTCVYAIFGYQDGREPYPYGLNTAKFKHTPDTTDIYCDSCEVGGNFIDGNSYLDARHTSRKRKRHADRLWKIWGGNDGSNSTVTDSDYYKKFVKYADSLRLKYIGDTARGDRVRVWDSTTHDWIEIPLDGNHYLYPDKYLHIDSVKNAYYNNLLNRNQ